MQLPSRGRIGTRATATLGAVAASLACAGAAYAATPTVTEFPSGPSPLSEPAAIAPGPDGNLWFTEIAGNKIGRITPSGAVTRFSTGLTAAAGLMAIAPGPDGNLWFTEGSKDKVGRVTTAGVISEFSNGITPVANPTSIVAGAAGPSGTVSLWFTEYAGNRIGQLDPATGVTTEHTAGITAGANPAVIAVGSDNAYWFTEIGGNRIGRITPSGTITEHSTGMTAGAGPSGIAAGPDGNLWFTEANANKIGRINPTTKAITEFSAGLSPGAVPVEIAAGPDGNLWFTESSGNRVGRITTSGVITEFSAGITPGANPQQITTGSDGNLWFTENSGNRIGRITTGVDPPRYTSSGAITIPAAGSADADGAGPAGPYPATINAAGHQGTVTSVSVRLNGIHHSYGSDVQAQLVGPGGQSAMLMSRLEGREVLDGEVLTFAENGVEAPERLTSGVFAPLGTGPALPGPGAPPAGATPDLSVFDGTNPNGAWKLYVNDKAPGDVGVISRGWSLDIATTGPPPAQAGGTGGGTGGGGTGGGGTGGGGGGGAAITPRDTTKPKLKLAKLAARTTLARFRNGVSVKVTPTEPVTLKATLSTTGRKPKRLATTTRRARKATTLKLKPSKKRLGRPKKTFKTRVTIVATDAAGNRTTSNRTVTVKP